MLFTLAVPVERLEALAIQFLTLRKSALGILGKLLILSGFCQAWLASERTSLEAG